MAIYLAGDIGGTKTELALFDSDPAGRLTERRAARYPSVHYPDLATIIDQFLGADPPTLQAAAFGVAGPVIAERAKITNLPWIIDASQLRRHLQIQSVHLLNDFHALALGLAHLAPHELDPLQPAPIDPLGPRALIGAGTGLGEALIVPTPTGPRVLATEGGHTDFAPRDDLEIELLRVLRRRHPHVSVERLVSGPGLITLYELLLELRQITEDPQTRARFAAEDPAAVITDRALNAHDPACLAVIDRFLSLYGAEAGNLALKTLPTGGLYIAGGIAPRLRPRIPHSPFLPAFLDKGRMRPLLQQIPIYLVLNPRIALTGAATAAAA